jgi:hypothetical protein
VNEKLRSRLQRAFQKADTAGTRKIDDAQRLFRIVQTLLKMKLVPAVDRDAIELACFALQLSQRQPKMTQRDRAEQAAELLISAAADDVDDALLEKTTRILQQLPQRAAKMDDARILSDALSLDDFGVCGLLAMTLDLSRQGGGIAQVVEGFEKREQYGYWDARLKDSFHFDQVRKLAAARLEHARATMKLLAEELP